MSDVRTDAELTRLAITLGVEREQVRAFEPAGAAAVRRLTEQISDALLDEHRGAFEHVATLAERLPAAVSATLSQRVLGPVLTARAAAALRPQKAAELARRFPPEFLAAVAASIDPRQVSELLNEIPPALATDVALALEREGETVPMGLLMSHLSPEALQAGAAALGDATILRAGLFVEDPARLDEVVTGLDDERLLRLATVAEAEGLDEELADLERRLGPQQRARVETLRAGRA